MAVPQGTYGRGGYPGGRKRVLTPKEIADANRPRKVIVFGQLNIGETEFTAQTQIMRTFEPGEPIHPEAGRRK